jgi:hypothetical protein
MWVVIKEENNFFLTWSIDIVYNVSTIGKISKIICKEKGGYKITIDNPSYGRQMVDIVPPKPKLIILEGKSFNEDQPLTNNPNIVDNMHHLKLQCTKAMVKEFPFLTFSLLMKSQLLTMNLEFPCMVMFLKIGGEYLLY